MANRTALLLLLAFAACLGTRPCAGQESRGERRERIENMSKGAKDQLLHLQERFGRLNRDEQNRLRQLNGDLEQEADAPRLRLVMQRYYEWLKTLTPYDRLELSQLSPEKRIERIKQLLDEQSRRQPPFQEMRPAEKIKKAVQQQAKRLGEELEVQDIGALFDWIAQIADRYEPRFLEAVPEPRRSAIAQQWESVKDPQRRRLIFAWLWMQWQLANPGKLPPLTNRDLVALRSKLSKATRERLESKPPPEQWRIVSDWISLLPQEKLTPRRADQMISEETERKLALFFEHVLSREEQDRLIALPSDQMFRELWREYARFEVSKTPSGSAEPSGTDRRPGAGKGQRGRALKAAPYATSATEAAKAPGKE